MHLKMYCFLQNEALLYISVQGNAYVFFNPLLVHLIGLHFLFYHQVYIYYYKCVYIQRISIFQTFLQIYTHTFTTIKYSVYLFTFSYGKQNENIIFIIIFVSLVMLVINNLLHVIHIYKHTIDKYKSRKYLRYGYNTERY